MNTIKNKKKCGGKLKFNGGGIDPTTMLLSQPTSFISGLDSSVMLGMINPQQNSNVGYQQRKQDAQQNGINMMKSAFTGKPGEALSTLANSIMTNIGDNKSLTSQGYSKGKEGLKAREVDTEFGNLLDQRNQMYGLADGGPIGEVDMQQQSLKNAYLRGDKRIQILPNGTYSPITSDTIGIKQPIDSTLVNEFRLQNNKTIPLQNFNVTTETPISVPKKGQRVNLDPRLLQYLTQPIISTKEDGGTILDSMNYIDGGFTHNDPNPMNVNKGVPVSPKDIAEKGELLHEGYVYSNNDKDKRFIITKDIAKELGLGKNSIGKTPAKAAKAIRDNLKNYAYNKLDEEEAKEKLQNLKQFNEQVIAQKEVEDYNSDMEDLMADGGWIQGAIKKKGSFTAQAKAKGLTPAEFQQQVLSNPDKYNETTVRRANLRKTLVGMKLDGGMTYHKGEVGGPSGQIGNFNYLTGETLPEPPFSMIAGVPGARTVAPTQPTQQPVKPIKYFSYKDLYTPNMTQQESIQANRAFIDNPNSFEELAQQKGYTMGQGNVLKQHYDDKTGLAGEVSVTDIVNADPEFIKSIFGNNFIGTKDQLFTLRRAIEEDPERYAQVKLRPGAKNEAGKDIYEMWGADWQNALKYRKPQLTQYPDEGQTGGGEGYSPGNPGWVDEGQTDTGGGESIPDPKPPTPSTTNWLRYAPIAGALPGLGMDLFGKKQKWENYDPVTMSSGLLNPQLVDEMTMRAGIDSANRGNIGALSNVTGGSGAAQRAGLLGAGTNYMDATNNAFMQTNQANNAARMGADQFNISNQADVAGKNMDALNQAEMYNNQGRNRINELNFNRKRDAMDSFQDIGNALGQIGTERDQMEMFAKVHGYNSYGDYIRDKKNPAYEFRNRAWDKANLDAMKSINSLSDQAYNKAMSAKITIPSMDYSAPKINGGYLIKRRSLK